MPIGQPTLLEFDYNRIENIIYDKTKFSFIEVEVECPSTVKAPLLLTRINNKIVAPIGKWRGIYTSIELQRAIKLGYKFKFFRCIYFESNIIFKDYVDFYYNYLEQV